MAVVADQVVVELQAKLDQYNRNVELAVTKFDKGMGVIEKRAKSAEGSFASFGKTFARGLLAGAGITGLTEIARGFREITANADHFVDTSERLGIPIKNLQELRYAGRLVDIEFGELSQGLDFFSRQIGQASRGSGDLHDILEANGIAIKDTNGSVRDANSLLLDYADLIKNAKSEQERAILIQRAFGRGGAEFANLFKNGAAGLRDAANEAERLGIVLDEKLLRQLGRVDDEFVKLEERLGTFAKEAAVGALNMFDQLSARTNTLANDLENFWSNPSVRNALIALAGKGATESGPLADFLKGAGVDVTPTTKDIATDLNSGVTEDRATRARASDYPSTGKTKTPELPGAAPKADEYKKATESIIERTQAIQTEISVVGLSVAQQERARIQLELEQATIKAWQPLNEERRAQIAELSDAYAAQVEILEAVAQRQQRIQEAAQASFDIVRQGFLDVILEGKNFNDVLAGVLKQLASLALNNLFTSLLAPKAGGGGFFNFLGSLFGGFHAKGGDIPSGRMGIVGEEGPEWAKGPMTVYPMAKGGGARGGQPVVVNQAFDFRGADAGAVASLSAKINRMKPEIIAASVAAVAGQRSRSPNYLAGGR